MNIEQLEQGASYSYKDVRVWAGRATGLWVILPILPFQNIGAGPGASMVVTPEVASDLAKSKSFA